MDGHHLQALILGFFWQKKTSSGLLPSPTTETPHMLVCSIYLAMRWLQWGWSQWLPFVQYGSSGEPNYKGVYSYPNQSTLHFGSTERTTYLTYDGGSFGPPCWAFKGSVEDISIGVVAVTVTIISIAVTVSIAIATIAAATISAVSSAASSSL
jgi:hypothetical protein